MSDIPPPLAAVRAFKQPIGDQDIVAFQFRRKPPAKPAEITRPGRWPSMRTSVARAACWRPALERISYHAASAKTAFADDETVSADRDHALQQVLEAARLDSQGKDHAEVAGLRFVGGRQGRGLRKLSLAAWATASRTLALAAFWSQFCRIGRKTMCSISRHAPLQSAICSATLVSWAAAHGGAATHCQSSTAAIQWGLANAAATCHENPPRIMSRFEHVYVLNVMSSDHPGIVAAVTSAVESLGGNIDACSQTVLGRLLHADHDRQPARADRARAAGRAGPRRRRRTVELPGAGPAARCSPRKTPPESRPTGSSSRPSARTSRHRPPLQPVPGRQGHQHR